MPYNRSRGAPTAARERAAQDDRMKQELILKSRFPHTEAALEKAVRIAVLIGVAVYWIHGVLTPRTPRAPRR
jgi:hypothetical protein